MFRLMLGLATQVHSKECSDAPLDVTASYSALSSRLRRTCRIGNQTQTTGGRAVLQRRVKAQHKCGLQPLGRLALRLSLQVEIGLLLRRRHALRKTAPVIFRHPVFPFEELGY